MRFKALWSDGKDMMGVFHQRGTGVMLMNMIVLHTDHVVLQVDAVLWVIVWTIHSTGRQCSYSAN